MLPGDVYYYSSNSLVLCVQQNVEKEDIPEPQVRRDCHHMAKNVPTTESSSNTHPSNTKISLSIKSCNWNDSSGRNYEYWISNVFFFYMSFSMSLALASLRTHCYSYYILDTCIQHRHHDLSQSVMICLFMFQCVGQELPVVIWSYWPVQYYLCIQDEVPQST
jgi:hypothetical protein